MLPRPPYCGVAGGPAVRAAKMAEAHSVVSKQKYPGIQTSATQAGVLLAVASLRVENWKAGFPKNEFLFWHFSPVSVEYGWWGGRFLAAEWKKRTSSGRSELAT